MTMIINMMTIVITIITVMMVTILTLMIKIDDNYDNDNNTFLNPSLYEYTSTSCQSTNSSVCPHGYPQVL